VSGNAQKVSPNPKKFKIHVKCAEIPGGPNAIIVLPYRGYFVHRLSHKNLVVSADTRNNEDDYSRALVIPRF
jgi:hypothetical protein